MTSQEELYGILSEERFISHSVILDQHLWYNALDMESSENLLAIQRLSKVYHTGKVRVAALNGVHLTLEAGKFMGVTGVSGSGKSTLLNLVGGLDTPTDGIIDAEGRLISEMDARELALYRRHFVGMIFQSFNLIPSFTAWENVGLPLIFAGVPKKERRRRAHDMLRQVGLQGRIAHRPSQLSGGEQQRVAIARALINRPRLILADEPTGNLDSRTSRDIVQLLGDLNRSQALAVIMVSHAESLLMEFAHTIVRLQDGEIVDTERLR